MRTTLCTLAVIGTTTGLKLASHDAAPSARDIRIATMTQPRKTLLADSPSAVRSMLNARFQAGPLKMPNGGSPCTDFSLADLHDVQMNLLPLAAPELVSKYAANGAGAYSHLAGAYSSSGSDTWTDGRTQAYGSIEELAAEHQRELAAAQQDSLAMEASRVGRCNDIAMTWAHHLTSAVREEIVMLNLMKMPLLPEFDRDHHYKMNLKRRLSVKSSLFSGGAGRRLQEQASQQASCSMGSFDDATLIANGYSDYVTATPVNGNWGGWGGCSANCGGGTQYRSCNSPAPADGGADCSGSASQSCNTGCCAVNGGWSGYGGWGGCSANCGGGTYYRYRSCNSPSASCGGSSCSGSDSESASCNTHNCPVNGAWSNWGSYDTCTAACNGGTYTRYRTCDGQAHGGNDCSGLDGGSSSHTVECNTHACPVNGGWSGWGACDKSCGTGYTYRSCTSPQPQNGGSDCSSLDGGSSSKTCNTHACPVNCVVAAWGAWPTCFHTCGTEGSQTRTRTHVAPTNGGTTCPSTSETRDCNRFACPQDCIPGSFGGWSTCTKSCGAGFQSRTRTNTAPQNGGVACPHTAETQVCNHGACPVHCATSAFGAWSTCTKSCGTGAQSRSRTVTAAAQHGGYVCPYLEETRVCNDNACPVDCQVAPWQNWSDCDKPCGTGSQHRHAYHVDPANGGVACPAFTETQACNTQACPSVCSDTKCVANWVGTKYETTVMFSDCREDKGNDFHCQHFEGTHQHTVLGGGTQTHTDECVCYCDHEASGSFLTHMGKKMQVASAPHACV